MKTLADAQQERKDAEKRREEIKKRQMILTLSKPGDIARIRFLRSIDPLIDAKKHESFDLVNPENSIRSMCATCYDELCYWCAMAKKRRDNELKPRGVYIYPIWVYDLQNPDMPEDDRNFYDDVTGYRLLVLNEKSLLNDSLISYHTDEGSVLGCDWKYVRIGSGKETKYTLTPKAPSTFAVTDLPDTDVDDIMHQMNQAYPMRVLDSSSPMAPFIPTPERPF